ncbi:hypothetical protein Pla86_25630 [Planctomycetes bacterium Pla86]|uniref:SGNH hydrolase-type esterase domain-containing protein n=1 Tax=Engelhardtia mirabilis TaxID=2528011 RepID=A0A518BKH8_9BACT|nr:hypothetical protein Pla133_25640 [Planctomycetes bacterium Pla133]QDV01807.1 hypothetical protein Pla86_25630 [Planctomycetes bacterium Pla86]
MTLAAPLVGLLLVELGLRVVVLTDIVADEAWAQPLREPLKYTRPRSPSGSDYWKLFYGQKEPQERWLPRRHPILGWIREDFDAQTYEHVDEVNLAGRRPVLLFGSSFVRCLPPVVDCHEDLLEQSPWASDLALLNFSVTGYGLGQVGTLLSLALPRFRAQNPIVVVAIQIDEDLDRLTLTFRHGPKPSFSLKQDKTLAIHVPDELDVDRYLALHPPQITSYAWNHLLFGTELIPNPPREGWRGMKRHWQTILPIVPRILLQVQKELAGLDYFVLLLGSPSSVDPDFKGDWRHAVMAESLKGLQVPYVSAHEMLREAVRGGALSVDDFFDAENGHPNERGVALIQRALERGLAGDFDPFTSAR